MHVRLRQVVMVARDIGEAEAAIESELGLDLCFRDPGVGLWGLTNALYPIGEKFLEVVSPVQSDTTAGRLLDKRGGDGGYMVVFQVDDLDEMRRRLTSTGARVVQELSVEGITGLHIHPRDIGGAIVSVDQTDDWDEWPWAGPSWRDHINTETVSDIVGVEVQAADPIDMARRWQEVLGGDLVDGTLYLSDGVVRFAVADGRGERLAGIDLCSPRQEAGQVEICGTTVSLIPHGASR